MIICELHIKTVVVTENGHCPLCSAEDEIRTWEKESSELKEKMSLNNIIETERAKP
jgi:hypothetical protein